MDKINSQYVTWHNATVTRNRRNHQNGHKSAILWFTGLSGSGKSTLAHTVEEKLHQLNYRAMVLDGDNIRHGLCKDLDFSDNDRKENIRRIGEVSKLLIEAGVITLTAFISPFSHDRDKVREIMLHGDFIEIFLDCSIKTCKKRDVKGLYKKAIAGEILNFTGINSLYEPPKNPDLSINTDNRTLDESVELVINMLIDRGIINNAD
jgi:adenylylsulfate kinase